MIELDYSGFLLDLHRGQSLAGFPIPFLAVLKARHGEALDQLWRREFGHGLDCLTEAEAQNLCRQPSVVAIEDFLAQAAIEARGRGLETAVGDGG